MDWVYDDGGRLASGFRDTKTRGDCVARAIAIVGGLDYREVWEDLHALQLHRRTRGTTAASRERTLSPDKGVQSVIYRGYLAARGWTWTPTMGIGTGTTVHLRADELPAGRLVARCSRHLVAVIDGVIHDTHDPSRDEGRCVYGFFQPPAS